MARQNRLASLLASTVLLLLYAATAHAAPSHDNFATPHLFGPPGGPLTEDNSDATTQTGEPLTEPLPGGSRPASCQNVRLALTLWYRVNGNGGPLTVITQRAGGSKYRGWVAAYRTSGADPNGFNLQGCGLDELTFDSVAGQSYLIQVGSTFCSLSPDHCIELNWNRGTRTVWSLEAPANDDRSNPHDVFAGQVTTVADSRGATTESGEITSCPDPPDLEQIRKTVWFRYDASELGRATFSASGFASPAIAVYRDGATGPSTCRKAASSATTVQVGLDVTPGRYLVQVGGRSGSGGRIDLQPQFTADLDIDDDGTNRPADCDDRDAAIHPGAVDVPDNGIDEDCSGFDAVDLDRDRDTFLRPQDCNDGAAGVHPGAIDTPDDGVDQDCSGVDAVDLDRDRDGIARPTDCRDDRADIRPGAIDTPGDGEDQDCDRFDASYPLLASRFAGFFAVFRKHTRFTDLYISTARAGSTLKLRCRGKGCPFKRRKREIASESRRLPLNSLVADGRFKRGTVLTALLTKPGTVGVFTRWRFRARELPKRSDLCKPPGAKKPGKCR